MTKTTQPAATFSPANGTNRYTVNTTTAYSTLNQAANAATELATTTAKPVLIRAEQRSNGAWLVMEAWAFRPTGQRLNIPA